MNPQGVPQNLTPILPGQALNPAGKGKIKPIADALRHMLLTAPITRYGKSETFRVGLPEKPRAVDYVAAKLIERAINGNETAFKELADRTEGKIAQPIIGSDDPSDPPVKLTRDNISIKEAARILGNLLLTADMLAIENQPKDITPSTDPISS